MSTAPLVATPRPSEAPRSAGMSLLSNGIPLSLLIDLAFGPNSEEVFAHELLEQRPPAA